MYTAAGPNIVLITKDDTRQEKEQIDYEQNYTENTPKQDVHGS